MADTGRATNDCVPRDGHGSRAQVDGRNTGRREHERLDHAWTRPANNHFARERQSCDRFIFSTRVRTFLLMRLGMGTFGGHGEAELSVAERGAEQRVGGKDRGPERRRSRVDGERKEEASFGCLPGLSTVRVMGGRRLLRAMLGGRRLLRAMLGG